MSEQNPAEPLHGRTAFVTGGGRGIGAAIARRLAQAGARVALVGRNAENLAAVAAQLPHDPLVIQADLAEPDTPKTVLKRVTDNFGKLDILVNNAGFGMFSRSDELAAAEFDDFMAVNLRAPLLFAGHAAGHMAEHGGGSDVAEAVLFLSSDAARNITGAVLDVDGGWGVFKPSVIGVDS